MKIKNEQIKDLAHYILVFGAIALAWIPVMNYMGGNVLYTSIIGLGVFIVADKTAHKVLKVK